MKRAYFCTHETHNRSMKHQLIILMFSSRAASHYHLHSRRNMMLLVVCFSECEECDKLQVICVSRETPATEHTLFSRSTYESKAGFLFSLHMRILLLYSWSAKTVCQDFIPISNAFKSAIKSDNNALDAASIAQIILKLLHIYIFHTGPAIKKVSGSLNCALIIALSTDVRLSVAG